MVQVAAFLFIVIVLVVTAPIWLFAIAAFSPQLAAIPVTLLVLFIGLLIRVAWAELMEARRRRLNS